MSEDLAAWRLLVRPPANPDYLPICAISVDLVDGQRSIARKMLWRSPSFQSALAQHPDAEPGRDAARGEHAADYGGPSWLKLVICASSGAARSGLKMVVLAPVDVVALWSREAAN